MIKITAGFNSTEDYVDCVKAGADELFCGFIPSGWYEKFGTSVPMNRREVLNTNVQIGAESELRILASMISDYGVDAALTFNRSCYSDDEIKYVADTICDCSDLGFRKYILGDPKLIEYLAVNGISEKVNIHVSGEYGELNVANIHQLGESNVTRIIFHRYNSFTDISNSVEAGKKSGISEFEAFFLNEKCHFNGAYCGSLHSDYIAPVCRLPYFVHGVDKKCSETEEENVSLGRSGCGFCSLPKLAASGATHLKIVGRGNHTERIVRDIQAAKKAIEIFGSRASESEYVYEMKKQLFSDGCSHNCYY